MTTKSTTPPTSVNFPPVEVHFCTKSGNLTATNSLKGFPTIKAARKFLRSKGYSIREAIITTREEPVPFPPTTLISIITEDHTPKATHAFNTATLIQWGYTILADCNVHPDFEDTLRIYYEDQTNQGHVLAELTAQEKAHVKAVFTKEFKGQGK